MTGGSARDTTPIIVEQFEKIISSLIEQYPVHSLFLVAVSGGADSCALCTALARLRSSLGFSLAAIHIVHNIRPEAQGREEAALVQRLCASYQLPLSIVEIPRGDIADRARRTGKGIEDAARFYRHRELKAAALRLGATRIVLGHTENDLLETTLMRLLRGSGPKGLAELPVDTGKIFRPMLRLSRADVLAYVQALKIPFAEDPSNQDIRYLRNRVRLNLVPLLDKDFPQWRKTVGAVARTQAEVAGFLHTHAAENVLWSKTKTGLATDRVAFFAQPAAVRYEALYQGINQFQELSGTAEKGDSADPAPRKKRAPARQALALLVEEKTSQVELGQVRLRLTTVALVIEASNRGQKERFFCLTVTKPGTYHFNDTCFTVGEEKTPAAVPVFLPAVVRQPLASEVPLLKERFPAFAAGDKTCILAEDTQGGAFLFFPDKTVAAKRQFLHNNGADGYAQPMFFFIL